METIDAAPKKKVGRKFDYRCDANATPLDKDILSTLRKNSLKYTKVYTKKEGKK